MILRKSVILSIIRGVHRHHTKLSKTFKIKELMIFESYDHCSRYSGTFISTFFALARVKKDFLEICDFLENLGRSSDVSSKLNEIFKI